MSHAKYAWSSFAGFFFFYSPFAMIVFVWPITFINCVLSPCPFVVDDGVRATERVRYKGLFDAFRLIIRQEGFLGLYQVH